MKIEITEDGPVRVDSERSSVKRVIGDDLGLTVFLGYHGKADVVVQWIDRANTAHETEVEIQILEPEGLNCRVLEDRRVDRSNWKGKR